MCMVWDAKSLGQKSSDALITAERFELHKSKMHTKSSLVITLIEEFNYENFISNPSLPVQSICVVTHTTNDSIIREVPRDGCF